MSSAELLARVSRLELENRWMRRIGAVTLVLGSVLILTGIGGPASPVTIEGERLVLKDKQGRPRLVFEVDADEGYAHLDLLDTSGDAHVRLGMMADLGPHLSFFQPKRQAEVLRIGLKPNSYQTHPFVEMTGEAKSGLVLAAAGQAGPQLVMRNASGDEVFRLGVDPDAGEADPIPPRR